jgi:general secretion pathway protein H
VLLLIAIVFPSVPFSTTPSRLSALVYSSASLLREARTAAIVGRTPVTARFDPIHRRLLSGLNIVDISADVDFSVISGATCAGRPAEIVFRPDGTNCGGSLRFSRGGRTLSARINAIDGQIDIVRDK